MFENKEGLSFRDVRDGLTHTIMVVEVDPEREVIWTKPDDWEPDPSQPLSGLGKAHPGGFEALFGDGSVHFISVTIDPETFKALLTRAGGERVPGL
jgi:hypothetical protein